MNIAQLLNHTLQHHGASLELIDHQTLKVHHAQNLPPYLTDLLRKYKPQIIRRVQLESAYQLLEYVRIEGTEIHLISPDRLRLDHAERLTDTDIRKMKALKAEIIEILSHTATTRNDLDPYVQHEIIQTYFDRLERHRSNLRKINSSVENALVKPNDLIQDLTVKFILNQEQAQQYITTMIQQRIFYYDSNSKFYLFPNFTHTTMHSFHKYNYAAQAIF